MSTTAGSASTGVDAELTTGITVSGTVTDSGGNPIPGINVWVNPDSSGSGAGAQTDANGNYTTSGLAPGSYRVQFSANGPDPAWATQFWNDQPSWNSSTLLTISDADTPNRAGIDAVLDQAATITGTVTDPHGAPVAGECVNTVVPSGQGYDGIANTNTGSDGTYALTGLPATPVLVLFQDCNQSGPYVDQWWDNQPDPSTALTIPLVAGATTPGIDAHLSVRGGDPRSREQRRWHAAPGDLRAGDPRRWFGGLARTDQNGDYSMTISRAGSYIVQFVDCNDSPAYAGQWWDDRRAPQPRR